MKTKIKRNIYKNKGKQTNKNNSNKKTFYYIKIWMLSGLVNNCFIKYKNKKALAAFSLWLRVAQDYISIFMFLVAIGNPKGELKAALPYLGYVIRT